MKGMSSPILSPQFRTRRDFFVVISTAIEGSGGEPVTTEVSTDSSVSFCGAIVDSLKSLIDTDFNVSTSSPIDVDVVGVVVRRVNRILFVLTIFSAGGVVNSSDSHAKREMFINSFLRRCKELCLLCFRKEGEKL